MLHSIVHARDKKHRQKDDDWKWFEDPYQSNTYQSGWTQHLLDRHDAKVPAPNPMFGLEPPVHTGFRQI